MESSNIAITGYVDVSGGFGGYAKNAVDIGGAGGQGGLIDIETREIAVQRSYEDFETFWRIAQTGPSVAPRIGVLGEAGKGRLKESLRERLRPDATGRITYGARANAIKGRMPR